MPKWLAPDADIIPPERWRELLAVVVDDLIANDEPFDASMTAIEAGLSDDETSAFITWVKEIELREEARQTGTELRITTDRLLEWMEKNPGKPFPTE